MKNMKIADSHARRVFAVNGYAAIVQCESLSFDFFGGKFAMIVAYRSGFLLRKGECEVMLFVGFADKRAAAAFAAFTGIH